MIVNPLLLTVIEGFEASHASQLHFWWPLGPAPLVDQIPDICLIREQANYLLNYFILHP